MYFVVNYAVLPLQTYSMKHTHTHTPDTLPLLCFHSLLLSVKKRMSEGQREGCEREVEKMKKQQKDIKRKGKGKTMNSKGVIRLCKTEWTRGKGREVTTEMFAAVCEAVCAGALTCV